MENIILKIVAVLCVTVVAIVTLIANKADEDIANGVWLYLIIALAIIFIPWKDVIPLLLKN